MMSSCNVKILGSSPVEYDFCGSCQLVVGRMCSISTREGERCFLRTLQLNKSEVISSCDLRIVHEIEYSTYRETCCALGLLSDDSEWIQILN